MGGTTRPRGPTWKGVRARLILVVFGSVVASCSGATMSPTASYFKGLDGAVVDEVLANPVAIQKIEETPSAEQASMAQGIVMNFITCRQGLRAFEEWRLTGRVPTLGPFPQPESPTEPSYTSNRTQYDVMSDALDSGEIDRLVFVLTANGSCGQWIPANPGEPGGPTVQDLVEGRSGP